ncbi:SusC/RagA family TonB-linked outer membrane protein [Porphyromonas sp.]|uniref:SusC/RagA family TonB-linked outer membrane protein n=1 Tax=Porphyromonas sp. TaxID=1924944 RepID=UPI0026DA9AF7|nr:SusC/RagA family TonB-linked outer membrane protein [Porphyromonas sp.]MDO4770441.1 SusC/RagA family TonB-linked outer membrane protein [Porphyromonas sp.]
MKSKHSTNHIVHRTSLAKWVAWGLIASFPLGMTAIAQTPSAPAKVSNQPKTVSVNLKGTVVDQSGEPMIGVTIRIKGTQFGCTTNFDGEFVFKGNLSDDSPVLILSSTGYKTIEVKVKAGKPIKITMEENTELLSEVVVTGIFQRKKEGFTGSANTMKGEEITKMTSGNVLKAIELLDPGFRLGSNTVVGSNPSGLPDFNVRGQASIGDYSTDDKVVLRGDVDTRPNQPLFVLDGIIGVPVTKILDIDPELIESVTILKDAAAMVLYGSRASNGVIVIETKAPAAGNLRVSYNGNYKLQYPDLRDYNLVNAAEKLDIEKRAGLYDEYYTAGTTLGILETLKHKELEVLRGVNTYWLSEPVRTAFAHRHGITVEGGDNTLRYKLYAGLNEAPGVMKGTGTYSKSGNIDIRYRQGKVLLSNILFVDFTNSDRTSPYGTFSQYTLLNPYYRKTNAQGEIPKYLETPISLGHTSYGNLIANPVHNTKLNTFDRNEALDIRNALKLEYTPMESLRLTLDATISRVQSENNLFKSANHSDFARVIELNDKGIYDWSRTLKKGYDVSATVSYNNMFKNKHFISAFTHFNIKEEVLHTAGIRQTGFPNETMDEVFLGSLPKNTSGNERTTRALGALGTVSYTYDQRYAVDANVRLDASSEFGRNNRLAPFWSVGMRWNLDKESFIKKNKWINELVLRSSYGVTGTQGFAPYQALKMYSYTGLVRIYDSSDVVGTQLIGLGNPDLKWQTTDAYNLGLDFNTFKGFFSGRIEYYYKYTRNMILDYSLAPSVGFSTVPENLGNISNRGFEFTARVMPINIPSKQFNLSFVVTGSQNKNRLERISNALKVRNEELLKPNDKGEYNISRPLPRYEEGYSQSMIWAVRSLGIDPQTGREIFLGRDGQRTTEWNPVDMVPVGDSEPKITGVFSTNLNWKGLSLSLAARYTYGGMLYNRTLVDKVENANLAYNVDRRAYTDRWQKPGDDARFKAIDKASRTSQTNASTRFLMENNELVFNVINAQYRFDSRNHEFIKKFGLTAASVGLYMEDLFRFNTIKVERGTSYPLARQVSMSLNLTF